MTTQEVLLQIRKEMNNVKIVLQNQAPFNSRYKGLYDYKPSNFIFVNNQRVFSNTNTLRNSVSEKEISIGEQNFVHRVFVSDGQVPYYRQAVLSPTLTRFFHYGRFDYGMGYEHSKTQIIENRNYLYYLKGTSQVRNIINNLPKEIEVTDSWG